LLLCTSKYCRNTQIGCVTTNDVSFLIERARMNEWASGPMGPASRLRGHVAHFAKDGLPLVSVHQSVSGFLPIQKPHSYSLTSSQLINMSPSFTYRPRSPAPLSANNTDRQQNLNFTLWHSMKSQRGRRGTALLFFKPRRLVAVGGQRHAPADLLPGNGTRYPLHRELGGPTAGLDGCGKCPPPTGIRSPDRPTRSESLYD